MSWFVYLIECRDGSLYTGIAVDVAKRYAQHAAGKGARYTRSHPPLRLLGSIPAPGSIECVEGGTRHEAIVGGRQARSLRADLVCGHCTTAVSVFGAVSIAIVSLTTGDVRLRAMDQTHPHHDHDHDAHGHGRWPSPWQVPRSRKAAKRWKAPRSCAMPTVTITMSMATITTARMPQAHNSRWRTTITVSTLTNMAMGIIPWATITVTPTPITTVIRMVTAAMVTAMRPRLSARLRDRDFAEPRLRDHRGGLRRARAFAVAGRRRRAQPQRRTGPGAGMGRQRAGQAPAHAAPHLWAAPILDPGLAVQRARAADRHRRRSRGRRLAGSVTRNPSPAAS